MTSNKQQNDFTAEGNRQLQEFYRRLNEWPMLGAVDISAIEGIPQRKIALYVEQGIVHPSELTPGKGRSRKFTITDLMLFHIINKLDRFGITPRSLRPMAEEIYRILHEQVYETEKRPVEIEIMLPEEGDGYVVKAFRKNERSEVYTRDVVLNINLLKIFEDVMTAYNEHVERTQTNPPKWPPL